MGHMIRKPKPKEVKAIKAVINILEKYRGGVVIAHKHPLHKAIVELEQFCRKRRYSSGRLCKQPYALWLPAKWMWYNLLWASRLGSNNLEIPKNINYQYLTRGYLSSSGNEANPRLAKQWAELLKIELEIWLTEFFALERK